MSSLSLLRSEIRGVLYRRSPTIGITCNSIYDLFHSGGSRVRYAVASLLSVASTVGFHYPGRALLNPYTNVYDRAQPNTLRITVVFLRNTWLSITIVILRVVYDRS